MKLITDPPCIEVVNQSECRLIGDVTYEFPGSGEPFGPHNLFLNATPEDIDRATAICDDALTLHGLMERVRRQPDILGPGGYRKSDTLGAFEPCTIGDRNFNLLREATLLVAVQEIPEFTPGDITQLSEWDCAMLRSTIEGARLLGVVMMNDSLISVDMGSLAARFINQYSGTDFSLRNSASNGARSLLQAVRSEYLNSVYGGPLENRLYPNPNLKSEAAIREYQDDNPFIVRLAS
jgi:hypothetical protein